MIKAFFSWLFTELKKLRYEVVYEELRIQDVTKGFDKRTKRHNVVKKGKRYLAYSQDFVLKRKGKEYKMSLPVKIKKKTVKLDGKRFVKAVLKTKKRGDTVWI